ncbi:MAG: hypothetical protein RLN90_04970 [Balneolaceae bacterium]
MNVGLITTFVIGGIFMISIMMFNQQLASGSQEFLLSTINQEYLDDLVTVITNDFNRIGYNTGSAVPFTTLQEDNIIFQADAYDNDTYGSTNIRWYFDTSDPVTSTDNPNDYYLKRIGPITANTYGTIKFPATLFKLQYYAANGSVTADKNSVKKIEVQIMAESGAPYTVGRNSEDFYPRSVWKRIFVPNNINLPY